MMIADRFNAMAALRGWTTETRLSILLDYIDRHDSDAAFLDFVARQDAHPAMNEADRFLWAVSERVQHPGLALDTFDLFTPDEAAAEWLRRRQT